MWVVGGTQNRRNYPGQIYPSWFSSPHISKATGILGAGYSVFNAAKDYFSNPQDSSGVSFTTKRKYSPYPESSSLSSTAKRLRSRVGQSSSSVSVNNTMPPRRRLSSGWRSRSNRRSSVGAVSRRSVKSKIRTRKPMAMRRRFHSVSRRLRSRPSLAFERRVMKAIVPIQYNTNQDSYQFTSSSNNCSFNTMVLGLQTAQEYVNLFTAGQLGANSNNSTQIELESSEITLRFINQDSLDANCVLYCLMPRRDVPAATGTFAQTLINGFVTSGMGNPNNDIRSTLFMCRDLMELYKIVRVTKFKLKPGHEFRRVFKGRPRRINQTIASTNWLAFRGYSKMFVLRLEGSVGNDSSQPTHVGISVGKVDAVVTTKYGFRFVNPLKTSYTSQGNLGVIGAHVQAIDVESGAVVGDNVQA